MKYMPAISLVIVLAALAARTADAQIYYYDEPYWYRSLEDALAWGSRSSSPGTATRTPGTLLPGRTLQRSRKKYILVYVHAPGELKPHNVFMNSDCIDASHYRGPWCFVKAEFERDNALLKKWGVRGPGTIVALDVQGNHFVTTRNFSIGAVRNLLKGMEAIIGKYQATLTARYKRALSSLKRSEKSGIKALSDIAREDKKGFREIEQANAKLNEIADARFKEAELAASVSPEDAFKMFDETAKLFESTVPQARALIAKAKLQRSLKKDDEAKATLEEVKKLDPDVFAGPILEAEMLLGEIRSGVEPAGAGAAAGPLKSVPGEFVLPATQAMLTGPRIERRNNTPPHIGNWKALNEVATWAIPAGAVGTFAVELTYGSTLLNGGGEFEFRVGTDKTLNAKTQDTGNFEVYKPHVIGTIDIAAGDRFLMVRPTKLYKEWFMDLLQVRLVPAAKAVAGPAPVAVPRGPVEGEVVLQPADAVLNGQQVITRLNTPTIAFWNRIGQDAGWKLPDGIAGEYTVEMTYWASPPQGGDFDVRLGTEVALKGKALPGPAERTYTPHVVGKIRIAPGTRIFVIRPTRFNRGWLMDLAKVRLIPVTPGK